VRICNRVNAEGTTTVRAHATDRAGNVEDPGAPSIVMIDTAPPLVTVDGPQARDYLHTDSLTPAFTASDARSGLASDPSAALDSAPVANGQAIDLLTVPLGQHVFTVSATDVAGSQATQTVTFRVIATIDSLITALNVFAAQGKIEGTVRNSLIAKLTEAKQALERANQTVFRNKLRELHQSSLWRDWRGNRPRGRPGADRRRGVPSRWGLIESTEYTAARSLVVT
jgi:hypothetical protein